MKHRLVIILTGLLAMLVIGCGYSTSGGTGDERSLSKPEKIKAEAFLYDVKIFQQGKKTSIRFEVYLTDSIAGLSAKGYLGKGALKGWLTSDSIAVYFSTMDEFVYDGVAALFSGKSCSGNSEGIDILSIFASLPAPELAEWGLVVDLDSSNSEKPAYTIHDSACDWQLYLEYDHRKEGPRLKKFEFDNGRGDRFTGKRRTFKPNAKIPANRFELAIPVGSKRITL